MDTYSTNVNQLGKFVKLVLRACVVGARTILWTSIQFKALARRESVTDVVKSIGQF